jgi:hypothetical protein
MQAAGCVLIKSHNQETQQSGWLKLVFCFVLFLTPLKQLVVFSFTVVMVLCVQKFGRSLPRQCCALGV